MHKWVKLFIYLQNILKIKIKERRPIVNEDKVFFLRQFATLMKAGVPLFESLTILERSQEKIALRILIYSLKKDVFSGKTLHESFSKQSRYFNHFICHLIQIGEQTGKLDTLLMVIAAHEEKRFIFINKIRSALFYPMLMIASAFFITACMLVFIVPAFIELFKDTKIQLPWLTRSIFYLSTQLNHHLFLSVVLFLLLSIFIYKGCQQFHFRETILYKMPIIKKYGEKILMARFARNLSTVVGAGIPLAEGMKWVAYSFNTTLFGKLIFTMRHKMHMGLALHAVMQNLSCFPLFMVQMVKVGEESGKLDEMLEKVAEFFETEIDLLMQKFEHLFEPFVMIVLGVLIGGLIVSMYLPIFELGDALQ